MNPVDPSIQCPPSIRSVVFESLAKTKNAKKEFNEFILKQFPSTNQLEQNKNLIKWIFFLIDIEWSCVPHNDRYEIVNWPNGINQQRDIVIEIAALYGKKQCLEIREKFTPEEYMRFTFARNISNAKAQRRFMKILSEVGRGQPYPILSHIYRKPMYPNLTQSNFPIPSHPKPTYSSNES